MKNKIIVGLVSSMLLTTFAPLMGSVVQAEESLEDLIEQKENNKGRSSELGSVIEKTEAEMNSLEQERQELEGNIQSLQITIQELSEDLDKQNQRLVETNEEIEKLNEEIEDLTKAIELRNDKLMTQARATQTKWNPTNIIHMIISAEDISDLISRVGIVSTLVSANQQVMEDQRRDQEAVIKAEAQVQTEKAEVETLVTGIEANREELTVQQVELDNEIMYVAERYEMNSTEKDQFVSEQFELAQETMALSSEIKEEKERLAEEKRLEEERIAEEKRLEAERIAEEKRLEEERLAEEKRLEEEEAIAKEAEEERQRQAEAERKEQVAIATEQRREEAQKEEAQKEEASRAAERDSAEQRRIEREKAAEQRAAAENRQEQERLARIEADRVAKAEAEARAEAAAEQREAARQEAAAVAATAAAQAQKEQAATPSNNTSASVAPTSSGWIRPASGYISSPFGYRTHPVTGQSLSFHSGVDIAGSGSIRASRAGTVTAASYSGSYGYRVIVDHGDGYSTLYAHMQPGLSVSTGRRVSQGQQLGIMGTTGRSTGVHLHFEVRKSGRAVNPMNYIN
ncbi:MAG: peptidoglycan DD-metalloendopeptidase family protein [Alkalibacterium sp.]|uniref:peptidoglycan DD-metalloendopeptidase family protein n=1 Tax=Alkalibacterium sp. TaxID=1872447 RepID=UPI003970D2CD